MELDKTRKSDKVAELDRWKNPAPKLRETAERFFGKEGAERYLKAKVRKTKAY